jgi:hypothetical protein
MLSVPPVPSNWGPGMEAPRCPNFSVGVFSACMKGQCIIGAWPRSVGGPSTRLGAPYLEFEMWDSTDPFGCGTARKPARAARPSPAGSAHVPGRSPGNGTPFDVAKDKKTRTLLPESGRGDTRSARAAGSTGIEGKGRGRSGRENGLPGGDAHAHLIQLCSRLLRFRSLRMPLD